jgi:hypothetical protein
MCNRPADQDEVLNSRDARPVQQPRPGVGEVGPAGACEAILGQAKPPVTRNGVLLLPQQPGGEPVTLELANRWRDDAS